MLPVVISLADSFAVDSAVAGNKAATLAGLLRQGFPVPEGFVLTTEGFEQILRANGGTESGDSRRVLAIPEDIRAQLARAITDFGDVRFAVRSSGVAEDLPGASFAGQYETVLGVRGIDGVLHGVSECLNSAFSPRVAVYRSGAIQSKISASDTAPLAVLVQRLVEPEAAGVAFTANPVTGDRGEVLVSAVKGLGERLVSGEVTPDEWVIKDGCPECRSRPEDAIDGDQARRIAELAILVQETLGGPQDIEWAIAGGELFLLQARPITALPTPPQFQPPTEGFWTKDTSHYPTPLTPFGASVYIPCVVEGTRAMCEAFGLLIEGLDQVSLGGEVYMRVVPLGGKDRAAPPWWLLAIVARLVPELRRRGSIAKRALQDGLALQLVERWHAEWRDGLRLEIEELRGRELAQLSDADLLEHLDRALDLLRRGERIHFLLSPPYLMAVYELTLACRELLGWQPAQALALLSGTSEASSEPGRRLEELAQMVAESEAALAEFEEPATTLAGLRERAPAVADAVALYIETYGHRTISYDPGESTFAERPELLLALLRDRVSDHRSPSPGPAIGREEAIAQARAQLAGHPDQKRIRFEEALSVAERVYPTREENIFYTDLMPNAVIRYAVIEVGRRLMQRELLERPDDAVFLTNEELRGPLMGGKADVRALAARRQSERAWIIAHPGPATYGKDPGPPPDGRALPRALRYTTDVSISMMDLMFVTPAASADDVIRGAPGSAGRYTGVVRVIRNESEFRTLRSGEVLVCPITSPSWSVLFTQAGALVTDGGGILAHAAIIAREYGIPAVLATGDATTRLHSGQTVTVDGSAGTVTPDG